LRLRWLWHSKTDDERAWQGLDLKFSEDTILRFDSPNPRQRTNRQVLGGQMDQRPRHP
jgi:hypothetical protein